MTIFFMQVLIPYLTFQKSSDAELVLMGATNKDIEKAWDHYNDALEEWNDDKYEKSIRDFQKAIKNVENALI